MHDDLRWNKLFGAILGTALFMMILGVGSQMFFAPKVAAKPGDQIAIQETSSEGGDSKPDVPPDWGTVLKTADVSAGQTVSTKCQSCHNFANGGPNQTGPNLWGVIGRPPASHPGFAYSSAMQDFGKKTPVWDYNHIYMFLAGPQNYISGTKMTFVGLKKPEDRINLIAWLRQQSSSPVPIPAPNPAAQTAAAAAAGQGPKGANGNDVAANPGAGAKQPVAVNGQVPIAEQTSTAQAPVKGAAGAAPARITSPGNGGGY
ncbi:MAG: cytochrome c family protein [Caulobacteraceae bacterium]|nr:cytochrome c family protein [Caulobacter sp.]